MTSRGGWAASAGFSHEIGKEPVGVQMLSDRIVMFRDDSGTIVAINDVCPHRGAPLHEGVPRFSPASTHVPSLHYEYM